MVELMVDQLTTITSEIWTIKLTICQVFMTKLRLYKQIKHVKLFIFLKYTYEIF